MLELAQLLNYILRSKVWDVIQFTAIQKTVAKLMSLIQLI